MTQRIEYRANCCHEDFLDKVNELVVDSPENLQELALLRSEAESLLLDAEFPGDPFQGPGPR